MKSEDGKDFLGKHLTNIDNLLKDNHDPKVKDLIQYNDAISLSNISFTEGFYNGVEFERKKSNYDTWTVSLFKKISTEGLPGLYKSYHSRTCVCYVPNLSIEADKYVIGYYDYSKEKWITCSCCGELDYFEPTHYLELPDAHAIRKEFDTTGQTRSTNQFKELPDGVYSGRFGGHVGMVEYLGKVYNFTFLKGIVQENIPKTITVVNGYGWTLLKDGPISPIV